MLIDKIIKSLSSGNCEISKEILKNPTCTQTGEQKCTCSNCNSIYTETIPALGHNYVLTSSQNPSCTEQGYKTYTCSRCEKSYTNNINSLEHHYGEWIIDKAAICTSNGHRYKTCSRCGDRIEETIPALGHNYVNDVCTNCGQSKIKTLNKINTNLTLEKGFKDLAATSVGNYALFAGGKNDSSYNRTVIAYNTSLTKTTAPDINAPKDSLAATTIGNYALFAGIGGRFTNFDSTDAYNDSLTKISVPSLTALTNGGREYLAATTLNNYALFGGGKNISTIVRSTVDVYTSSLTLITAPDLRIARCYLAATSIENYALFAGGNTTTNVSKTNSSSIVDVYTSSLTLITAPDLSNARYHLVATSVGNYALFAGGRSGSTIYATIDVYNNSLTKTSLSLSNARYNLAATSIGNYALFGGGATASLIENDTHITSIVDVFDDSLTKMSITNLSNSVYSLAATSVGNYALFAGGKKTGNIYPTAIDVYQIS